MAQLQYNPELVESLKAVIQGDDRFEFAPVAPSSHPCSALEYIVRRCRDVRCVDRDDKTKMALDVETIPQYLWPAAIPLSAWILAHKELFEGKTVIELGSGVGLGGFTAALFAKLVVLTDCSPVSLAMLEISGERNRGKSRGDIGVEFLKWGDEAAAGALLGKYGLQSFDVVIGCDIFYFNTSLVLGLATARKALGGAGCFVCASLARSERMDVDIDDVPLRSGEFRGGRIDTNEDEGGLRVYQWFPVGA